ncbi:uncharacterized protein LOC111041564 [Myzus persicae]|uniref:uncharacterized protein LOC111041564 n=1 Tax=Myzus persicae TaxID=13164 RepID=UPI000B93280F|nr:uncharacterized protein LOC111041564 [Myzus persicae]
MNDKIRTLLIEHGPEQGKNSDFSYSENFQQRKFSADWFFKTLPNGDKIERNPKTGFNDWRKLSPRIPDHENTFDHKSNVFTWKSFEKRLREGKTIDKELQKESSSNDITKSNCCIFLNLIELISSYNPIIAQHLSNSNRRTTYLSNKVQNEFICLLGNSVRGKIISNIKEAKYYSIIFDSTPDISHKEQMTQIVRYVAESNDKYIIEESFIDFITTTKKTGQGLAEEILKKLSEDGLEFKNCRGQGYDNGANMSGKIKGVLSRLQEINKYAQYVLVPRIV